MANQTSQNLLSFFNATDLTGRICHRMLANKASVYDTYVPYAYRGDPRRTGIA